MTKREYRKYRETLFTPEQAEEIYNKYSNELDLLIDDKSRFIYFKKGKRRILVDKDEQDIKNIRYKFRRGYIYILIGNRPFARVILGITNKSNLADHINRNVLDNRRCNLREVSTGKNRLNSGRNNYKYNYKGVKVNKTNYYLTIHSDYKTYTLSLPNSFTEEECAKVYDMLALYFNGDFHFTNFDKASYSKYDIEQNWFKFSWAINEISREHKKKYLSSSK